MAREEYQLLPDEEIILLEHQVSHGHLGSYKDDLILTNLGLIIINRGSFESIKQASKYSFSDIHSVEMTDFTPKIKQLEIRHQTGTEYLLFMTNDEFEIKLWDLAIKDQKSKDKEQFRADYYQEIRKRFKSYVTEILPREQGDEYNRKKGKVGNSTLITQKMKRDIGLPTFKDQFTSVGNDFRKKWGMDTKATRAEEVLYKKQQAFEKIVAEVKEKYLENTNNDSLEQGNKSQLLSLDEQIEAVKKMKDLLDTGILTQEEFDLKKKDILKL